MKPEMKAALWRGAKVLGAGLISAVLLAIVSDQSAFSGIMAGDFTPDFWRKVGGIALTAAIMFLLKYFNVKIPPNSKASDN